MGTRGSIKTLGYTSSSLLGNLKIPFCLNQSRPYSEPSQPLAQTSTNSSQEYFLPGCSQFGFLNLSLTFSIMYISSSRSSLSASSRKTSAEQRAWPRGFTAG